MSDDLRDPRARPAGIALFAAIAGLITWDLWVDYGEGVAPQHVIVESLILVAALSGIVLLWRRLDRATTGMAVAQATAERWQREHRELLRGLGQAIAGQFDDWRLSNAEAEVGLLLLKGLSLKEIAGLRETSERTVREQARAIYRKAGLSGRSALAAFFLEDLLLPLPGGSGAHDQVD